MIKELARAKINLCLRVLAKRSDGFHELETVFCEIDLADELRYQPGEPPFKLAISGAQLSTGDDNLIVKAVRVFEAHMGAPVGGQVWLTKRIPMGAGLGGGSSDAAAMLRVLDRVYHTNLGRSVLLELAEKLGSDVPFFIAGGCQLGRGRGELLTPWTLPAKMKRGFLACLPIHMPTAQVFRACRVPEPQQTEGPNWIGENHLLAAARSVSPQFDQIWKSLHARLGMEPFFMTGSGSSLVWLTDDLQVPTDVSDLLAEHQGVWLPFVLMDQRRDEP